MSYRESYKVKSWRGGWIAYARILRTVIDMQPTMNELAEAHSIGQEAARQIVRRMLGLGLVHIGSTKPGRKGPPVACWHFGPGDNAECARYAPMRPNSELIAFASMVKALQERQHSARTLAAATGTHEERTILFLRCLREELRLVYVSSWVRSRINGGATPTAFHMFGIDEKSVPRPAPVPKSDVDRLYRKRKAARELHADAPRTRLVNASIFTLAQAA
jgi:hypothetical protein